VRRGMKPEETSRIQLLSAREPGYHVSHDTVREFEEAILCDPRVSRVTPASRLASRSSYLAWRALDRACPRLGRKMGMACNRMLSRDSQYFAVLIHLNFSQCLPHFMVPGRKNIYIFDAWPARHQAIQRFVSFFDVDHAFISSSECAIKLQEASSRKIYHWIPEGIQPKEYRQRSYQEKDIDVLAFGRRYGNHHDRIVDQLGAGGWIYQYQESDDGLIFPDREAFVDGLARTKISICFPAGLTHPQSGGMETMTIRYLQSMVSKCLIVGHAPNEMLSLFQYNPIIEADMQDPAGQLAHILDHYSEYYPLVEKNFQIVTQGHSWKNRWEQIRQIIRS
jgi:hypothetical protein